MTISDIIMYIIFIILLLYLVLRTTFYIVWRLNLDDESIKITFNMFKKLYPLYPSKWGLYESSVAYRPNGNYYHVEFKTFHDVLMYKIFKHRIEKKEKNIRKDKETRDFLKDLQKDIDKYKEENFSEIKKHIVVKEGNK